MRRISCAHRRGFTLVELLIVIGIIGILASVTIQAISPRKQLLAAEDTKRTQYASELRKAMLQYLIKNSALPNDAQIPNGYFAAICAQGVTDPDCISMDVLAPTYLGFIPQDKAEQCANFSGYLVTKQGTTPTVIAEHMGLFSGTSTLCGFSASKIGAWTFDEGVGTTISDSVGSVIGTLQNGTSWVAGKFGNGLSFDGNDDIVDMGAAGSLATNPMSVSFWINTNNSNGNGDAILGKSNGNSWIQGWGFKFTGATTVGFFVEGDSVNIATGTIPTNQWVHVAGTWDGTTIRLYVNGSLVGTDNYNGSVSGTNTFYIGQLGTSNNRFTGSLDDLRFYSRTLSVTDVALIMQGL